MSALKGSTTLARKQARAGHSPVWQRKQLLTGDLGTSHLSANPVVTANGTSCCWHCLWASAKLQTQASCMTKGKSTTSPRPPQKICCLVCSVSDYHGATPVTLQQEWGDSQQNFRGAKPNTSWRARSSRGREASWENRGRNETVKSNPSGLFVSYGCHHMDRTPTLFKAREQLTHVICFKKPSSPQNNLSSGIILEEYQESVTTPSGLPNQIKIPYNYRCIYVNLESQEVTT